MTYIAVIASLISDDSHTHFRTDNCNKLSLSLKSVTELVFSQNSYGVHVADTKYLPILKDKENDTMKN